MAVTLQSDVKTYDPRIQIGYRDKLAQNLEIFNGASQNCIRLSTESKPGDFDYRAFWARAAGIASRRDMTSTSTATAIKIAQSEIAGVKLNRKIGPLEVTPGALRKIGLGVGEDDAAMVAFGEYVAEATLAERVDTAILALRAAINNVSGLKNDISGGSGAAAKASADALAATLAKRGDMAKDVACWVMHSKPFFDLIGNQIAGNVTGVASVVMMGGMPATLGRPVLVTDSASLLVTGTPDKYYTLGLVPGAAEVTDTEEEYVVNQIVTGGEQIIHRMQGEYAYNLDLLGYTWDVANGGANPTNSTLSTGTNWDKVVTSDKSLAGVVLVTQ